LSLEATNERNMHRTTTSPHRESFLKELKTQIDAKRFRDAR